MESFHNPSPSIPGPSKPEIIPDQSPPKIIGCLLDVSGSMRSALEVGRDDNATTDRFRAILSAAIKLARAEQSRDPSALMFVGAFGLLEEEPTIVDLCGVAEALVGEEKDKEKSGHDLLIRIANENRQEHIEKYIRTKLTDDEARMVYVYLGKHSEKIKEFTDAISSSLTVNLVHFSSEAVGNAVDSLEKVPIIHQSSRLVEAAGSPFNPIAPATAGEADVTSAKSTADVIEDWTVDRSEAMYLARRICKEWLQDFSKLEPRRVDKVVTLLQKLENNRTTGNSSDGGKPKSNTLLDKLRKHVYGRTPMQESLEQSLEVFKHHRDAENRVLVLFSDGVSTDGDPLPIAQQLKEADVIIATLYLTSDPNVTFQRHLHYEAANDWNDGQQTLFNMAHRVSCLEHPIPVLATLGWKIPSAGEAALHATVNSAAALDEFCSMLLAARFGSAETLLDILGRVDIDKYVHDEYVRNCSNPSDQGDAGVCYAHATAFVLHSALLRIVGRTGGYPTIEQIRDRILAKFPACDQGWNTEVVLRKAIKWYPPLRFDKVDEDAARQAVLRRRFVLSTFHLSEPGWDAFTQHFCSTAATRCDVLTRAKMEAHRDLEQDGGHAVALVDCTPNALTFVNSWGRDWGNEGRFSVENASSLESMYGRDDRTRARVTACFYDVYWWERKLDQSERMAYERRVQERLHERAEMYSGILEMEAQCPICRNISPVIEFGGNVLRAVCPAEGCGKGFKPQGDHLLQALYTRAGVSGTMN